MKKQPQTVIHGTPQLNKGDEQKRGFTVHSAVIVLK